MTAHGDTSGAGHRVLVLPLEIAGVAQGLVTGLREIGESADLVLRQPHQFRYGRPVAGSRTVRVLQRALDWAGRGRSAPLRQHLTLPLRLLSLPFLRRGYDAFLYLGPTTLTGAAWERAFLRAGRRRVITVFLGSDARPSYLDACFIDPEAGLDDRALDLVRRLAAAGKRRVAAAETSSDVVVNATQTAQFASRPFVDLAVMGLPTPAPAVSHRHRSAGAPLRIVHAPSAPRWKGTERIRAAVAAVADDETVEYVEYVEIVGLPHEEVVRTLATADLAVDQTWSDVMLSAFGAESAAHGVLPLLFGLAGDQVRERAAAHGQPDDCYHDSSGLQETIRHFVGDSRARQEAASRMHHFVATEWSPAAVAERYVRLIEGREDPGWWCDPRQVSYLRGYGMSDERRREHLQRYLARFGPAALQLDDRLTQAVLDELAQPAPHRGRP